MVWLGVFKDFSFSLAKSERSIIRNASFLAIKNLTMKTMKVAFLTAGLMFLGFFATFVFATGIESELNEAIVSSNLLLSEVSGETEIGNNDSLVVDENDENFSFQKGYAVSHCEINGEEVPCEEFFEDAQAMFSTFFQEIPFLRVIEN